MEATSGSEARNILFQKLKPCCVKISQLAIRESDEPGTHKELLDLTAQILAILDDQIATNPLTLDEKLAEYVFFPLYHVFRQMERYPMTLVENCIKCLTLLIVHGWRSRISSQLVQQIFSLLSFIINGTPGSQGKKSPEKPEEILLAAFRAETALLNVASTSPTAATGLSDPGAIPDLGHGITVMLDHIVDGATPEIQKEAIRALAAVYGALREHAALATFLPGTISSMTKVLSSPARHKKLVLSKSLGTVQVVLIKVLGDLRTRPILAKESRKESAKGDTESSQVLSPAWLKATVSQVKKALSIMMKLRSHESYEVRDALEKLCISLLDECHHTLSDCTAMLVETAMVMDRGMEMDSSSEMTLRHLVSLYPELGESVKNTVYNWMSSLPRITQLSDEDRRESAMHNFSKGIKLLRGLGIESSVLDDSISSSLRDTLVSLITYSKDHQANTTTSQILLLDKDGATGANSGDSPYLPVLLAQQGQKRLRGEIVNLLQILGASSRQVKTASSLLENARESTSTTQVAAFWLCFELLKAAHSSSADTEALFDLSAFMDPSEDMDVVFNELYTFSLLLLDSHSESSQADWRLEAIALEAVAYASQRSKEAFRPELIDALFPVATFLGSENANLQQHAVVTLNTIAASCGYNSVSDLIIDNVDYMVNSVSLRLNTLDISPSSTHVLLMMVRLSGPRLVPFLDDVVDSIFAALDNYHGYTTFVESLFAVLKEVVSQAARADEKLLTDGERSIVNHQKERQPLKGLDSLFEFLDQRDRRKKRDEAETEEEDVIRGHPTTPWKESTAKGRDGEEDDADGKQMEAPRDEEKTANSPTYQLLQKIANLTQHYLTSPTSTLRRSLLELLETASPVLAADEDSFLPLVNAIWPVVINKLRDPEAFVQIEACSALSELCKAAGDFLSTRFKTEWWDWLGDWCRKVKAQSSTREGRSSDPSGSKEPSKDIMLPFRSRDGSNQLMVTSVQSRQAFLSGGLGQYASATKIWEAVIKLLTSILSYVRIDEEMYDEILGLLADVMDKNPEVLKALEVINADAVWLARYERGLVQFEPLVV